MALLICDDSKVQGSTFRKILEKCGFTVHLEDNIKDSLKHIPKIRAAFVDANIEGTFDGVNLVRDIKQKDPQIKTFLYTAETEECLAEKRSIMYEAGVDAVLPKMAPDKLRDKALELLEQFGVSSESLAKVDIADEIETLTENASEQDQPKVVPTDRKQRVADVIKEQAKDQRVKEIDFELKSINRRLESLQSKLTSHDNSQLKDELNTTNQNLQELGSQLSEIQSKMSDELSKFKEQLSDVPSGQAINQLQDDVTRISDEHAETLNSMDSKVKNLERTASRISDIELTVRQTLSQIKSQPIPASAESQNPENLDVNNLIEQLTPVLKSKLEISENVDHTSEIKAIFQKLTELEESISNRASHDSQIDIEKITKLQQSLFTQKKEFTDIISKVNLKCDEIHSLEGTLKESLEPLESSLKETSERYKDEQRVILKEAQEASTQLEEKFNSIMQSMQNGIRELANDLVNSIVEDKRNSLEFDLTRAIEDKVSPEGGIATKKRMEEFLDERLNSKVHHFREVVSENQSEMLRKNKDSLQELARDMKPDQEQVKSAVRDVAKSGVAKRVAERISPDIVALARSEVLMAKSGITLTAIIGGGIFGCILTIAFLHFFGGLIWG